MTVSDFDSTSLLELDCTELVVPPNKKVQSPLLNCAWPYVAEALLEDDCDELILSYVQTSLPLEFFVTILGRA